MLRPRLTANGYSERCVRFATLTLRALATERISQDYARDRHTRISQGRRARHYHNHTIITDSSMTVEEGQTLLESGKPVPKSFRRPHKDFPTALNSARAGTRASSWRSRWRSASSSAGASAAASGSEVAATDFPARAGRPRGRADGY